MNFHSHAEFLREDSQAQILNEHRVHTGGVERDELTFGGW